MSLAFLHIAKWLFKVVVPDTNVSTLGHVFSNEPLTALLASFVSLIAHHCMLRPSVLPQILTEWSSQLEGDVLFCMRVGKGLKQRFSIAVPPEFFTHAVPDYLVRGIGLFSLRLPNIKITTANTTIAVWCE